MQLNTEYISKTKFL